MTRGGRVNFFRSEGETTGVEPSGRNFPGGNIPVTRKTIVCAGLGINEAEDRSQQKVICFYTVGNFYEILLNQTEIRLYLTLSD